MLGHHSALTWMDQHLSPTSQLTNHSRRLTHHPTALAGGPLWKNVTFVSFIQIGMLTQDVSKCEKNMGMKKIQHRQPTEPSMVFRPVTTNLLCRAMIRSDRLIIQGSCVDMTPMCDTISIGRNYHNTPFLM